jgi:hypothetical protein
VEGGENNNNIIIIPGKKEIKPLGTPLSWASIKVKTKCWFSSRREREGGEM